MLLMHALSTLVRLEQRILSCISEHIGEGVSVWLIATNSLKKVRLVEEANMHSHQLKGQEQVARYEHECSACRTELPLGPEIYIAPFCHQCDCDCLT